MNKFNYELQDSEIVDVEYQPVDYDDSNNLVFEIYVYKGKKEIWDELSTIDQYEIEAKVEIDWKQYYKYEKTEAAIARWQSDNNI